MGRQRRRPGRRSARRHLQPRRAAPNHLASRRTRRSSGLRHRRARRCRRPRRRPHPCVGGRRRSRALRYPPITARTFRRRATGPPLPTSRPPHSPACQPGTRAGTPAFPRSRPRRDQSPLRPVERLLRTDPRRAHGVLERLLDVGSPRLHAGRRTGGQTRSRLPQGGSGFGCRTAIPGHRVRMGLAIALCGRALRCTSGRRDHLTRTEGIHRRAHRAARPGRPRRDPRAGLPRDPRPSVRRRGVVGDGRARR